MDQPKWANVCCNPFGKAKHSYMRNNLRPVLPWMCEKLSSLTLGAKVCDTCRKKLTQVPIARPESTDQFESSLDDAGASSQEEVSYQQESLESINQCLSAIGETPVVKKKLQQAKYPKEKMQKIRAAVKKKMLPEIESSDIDDESEIITQLKDKFQATTKRSEKVQILTVLPKSWTIRKVQDEFGASNYMVRKAKELVKQKGVLSTPNPKSGHALAVETTALVQSFYESDEVSRMMPGKKDYVSVRQAEERVHVQKRLVLSNLKEVYQLFKEMFPTKTIGFSKFAELRPKHCVLAGASGTHAVCVCTIHQNVKLMMVGGKVADLTADEDISLRSYDHCLAQMICNPPQPACYFSACCSCPGISGLKERLKSLMDDNLIDSVVYKQWVSVDRSTLETFSKSAYDFVDALCEKLEILLPHSFIARQQSSFQKELRSDLHPGEFLVIADFSENYSFVLQDAAQGFHWNNSQATIHPFVAYYMDSDELRHLSYVIISDCLHHDTVAVHLFLKSLIEYLKERFGSLPHKIFYFSDGAAAQYKNRKNFINLCHHQADFGVPAEWHFYATSHGKGACDGVGGTVKRLAARASLQCPYDHQIMTPRQLFEWAVENIPATSFQYLTMDDYKREHTHLEQRFRQSRTIPGTRKLHSFVPLSRIKVSTKVYSFSATSKEERVTVLENEVASEEIKGFVTCVYDKEWWVGCVLQVDEDSEQVNVSFLHPHGPSRSFKYPAKPDILNISVRDVLTRVDPRTARGRTYTLTQKETRAATEKLNLWNN